MQLSELYNKSLGEYGFKIPVTLPREVKKPEVFGLSGKEEVLANKVAEQDSKGIDWAEFDKQDQIIFSSNE